MYRQIIKISKIRRTTTTIIKEIVFFLGGWSYIIFIQNQFIENQCDFKE